MDPRELTAIRIRRRRRTESLLAVRGASGAWHRDGRGAVMGRRDNREYRTYLRAEQRRQRGCIARRMQRHLHHGLLAERPHDHWLKAPAASFFVWALTSGGQPAT